MAPGSKIDQSLDDIIKNTRGSGGAKGGGKAGKAGGKGKGGGGGKGGMRAWGEEPRKAKGKGKGKGQASSGMIRATPFVKQLLRAAATGAWAPDSWSPARWGKGSGKGSAKGKGKGSWSVRAQSAGTRLTGAANLKGRGRVLRTIMKPTSFQGRGNFGGAKKMGTGGPGRADGQWTHDLYPGAPAKAAKGGKGGGKGAGAAAASGSMEPGLFISNLDYNVTAQDIFDHFRAAGGVQLAWVEYDRTDRSLGTGGVVLNDSNALHRVARQYHGRPLGMLPLEVRVESLPLPSRQAVLAGPAAW